MKKIILSLSLILLLSACSNPPIIIETEVQRAIKAKQIKADYELRLKERIKFCGEGNVDENFGSAWGYESMSLPCKDYSLVPDENLK